MRRSHRQHRQLGVLVGAFTAFGGIVPRRRAIHGDAAHLEQPGLRALRGRDRDARSLDVHRAICLPASANRDVRGRMKNRVAPSGRSPERRLVEHVAWNDVHAARQRRAGALRVTRESAYEPAVRQEAIDDV